MIRRAFAGAFGALVVGILTPVLYLLLVGVPGSLMAVIGIVLLGVLTGAILGTLFPRFFGFVFEMFMDV